MMEGKVVPEITDYFLAVYLLAMGENLTDLQVQPKEVFHFADSPALPQHIEAYRADTALVNPKVFARKIMELRQQLKQRHDEAAAPPP
jgi:hypothetical protein